MTHAATPVAAGRATVLGFFAHPDDETLSAGGTLALLARRADVHIITATRGEMGEVVGPLAERTTPDREELPILRTREVTLAAARLGVTSHEFLDGGDGRFQDSGMVWEDDRRIRALPDPHAPAGAFARIGLEEPAALLAARIIDLKPDLLLTEEPAGGYGHPDHIRCHDVAMRALEIAAPTWRVPLVAFAVQEESRVRAANEELAAHPELPTRDEYGVPFTRPDLDTPLRTGVHARPDAVLDTSGVTGSLIGAMRAHATQVHAVTEHRGAHLAGWFALTNNDLKPIPTHAGLVLAPGWGTREELAEFLSDGQETEPTGEGRLYGAFLHVFALFSGVVVGLAGSFTHRNTPWGLPIALIAVLAGATLNRTIGSAATALTYTAGLVGAVLAVTTVRSGGDIVIVEDALGLGWLVGVFIASLVGGLIGGGATRARSARERGRTA